MSETDPVEIARVKKNEESDIRINVRTLDGRRLLALQICRRDGKTTSPTKHVVEARAGVWKRLLPEIASALDLMEAEAKGGEVEL